MSATSSPPIFTIGHSTRPLDEFLELLAESRVQCVVDVRRLPGSRAFPQYDADALEASLQQAGIDYRWLAALGGRRGRRAGQADARNAYWNNASFRRYADYALTDEFDEGLQELRESAARQRCALMCAEAVWWRCHRRIIADHLLAEGFEVLHIMGPGKVVPATLTPGARAAHGEVTYPAPDADALSPQAKEHSS